MSEEKKFTPKQAMFIKEYLIDLNATQAALRAGYAVKSAHVAAARLLSNDKVKAELDRAVEDRSERTEITQDWVLKSLKSVAERCMQAEPVIDKEGNPTGEYKFDASGANKSLELLGKHLRLFTDKVESEVKTPIQVNVSGPGFPPMPSTIFEWEQQMKEYLKKRKNKESEDETDNEDDEK